MTSLDKRSMHAHDFTLDADVAVLLEIPSLDDVSEALATGEEEAFQ